ncbi:hypothetical protein PCANC_00188 [Puccinia coronata f. sp. avenae]|uniref:Uncharacterized protein n=1 Tax=Puccinia coronata f. sp. avenae TaxID=200324 RepID=A0A2N5W8H1_9BASI|nr:hypothetical protein PCANC_00188 [Puccinia coronata f. sp. avenae]
MSELAGPDAEAPPPEDQIVAILTRLTDKWNGWIDMPGFDEREERTEPLPILPEEISPKKEKLLEIQTSMLPQVKQQLNNLLRAFGLGEDAPKESSPQLAEVLDIMTKFGPAIDHINSAIDYLAPWRIEGVVYRTTSLDANDGTLKKIRTDYLKSDLLILLNEKFERGYFFKTSNDIRGLFLNYMEYIRSGQLYPDHPSHFEDDESKPKLKDRIIQQTALICRKVDTMIDRSTRSDLGMLQVDWKLFVGYMSDLLPRFTSTTQALKKANKPEPATPDQSDIPNDLPRLVKALVIKLLEQAVILVKLNRIFLNKLLDTPTRKTPITIGGNLSSNLLAQLRGNAREVTCQIEYLARDLIEIAKAQHITIDLARGIIRDIARAARGIDREWKLLPNLILPPASAVDPPSGQAVFDDLFSDIIPPFNLAFQNIMDTSDSLLCLLQEKLPQSHHGRFDARGDDGLTFH